MYNNHVSESIEIIEIKTDCCNDCKCYPNCCSDCKCEDISQGVPVSYSGQINTPGRVPRPQKQNSIYTYYGHGIPLITTKPGPIQNPLLLPHNMGLRCAPECCPSPYSCDHGCLCADLRHMK